MCFFALQQPGRPSLTMVGVFALQFHLYPDHCILQVDAIIFLAPISGFDQVLVEDRTVNRLVRFCLHCSRAITLTAFSCHSWFPTQPS